MWLNSAQATPQSVAPPTVASPRPARHLAKTTQHRSGGLHYTRTPRRANAYSDGMGGRVHIHTAACDHVRSMSMRHHSAYQHNIQLHMLWEDGRWGTPRDSL